MGVVNYFQTATPQIFALAESVFMAAETVTPNAPPTSPFFQSAVGATSL